MLKIRLRRGGAKHSPFYRIVVSDSLRTPAAATVEQIGTYDPTRKPSHLSIDKERVDFWLSRGAQMSQTVSSLVKRHQA
jgi:small subunit ribosomal protein S16